MTSGGHVRDREALIARRRAAAERARQRRVLGFDVALALLAAVLVLVVGPGLALAAVAAGVVLLVCGVSYWVQRRRRRTRVARLPPDPEE